jgi:mannose-1-phosphate guanylyltransferase
VSPSSCATTPIGKAQLWAIVLAGGSGTRLRPLVRRACGDERPKQYATLVGTRSLLEHTLSRVALEVPPARTAVVTLSEHQRYLSGLGPPLHVLSQPDDRGTAAGMLLPAHWIHWRDPEAVVAVFPADHFVLEADAFMAHVGEVVAFVRRDPRWLVLLAARPTSPDPDYGWLEAGEPLVQDGAEPVHRVRRFREKPPEDVARACFSDGWLWNTLVLVARVGKLLEVGHRCLPHLSRLLAQIAPFDDFDRSWALRHGYADTHPADFSRAVLERCPESLAVSRLPRLTWSDWGTPERVVATLAQVGITAPWLPQSA